MADKIDVKERYLIRLDYYRCPNCGATHNGPIGELKDRSIRRCNKCRKVVTMEITG